MFKEYTGLTPNEYVSQIRINKAMQLLSKSNDTILEIAYDAGFKSLSNMNFANKLGVENVILIGEEEMIENKVKIKNMRSGNDKKVDYRLL